MKRAIFLLLQCGIFWCVIFCCAGALEAQPRQKNKKQIALGDVTRKAVYLPPPRVPVDIQYPPNSIVRVRITIDLLSGRVIAARAVSGATNLRSQAEQSALCARFAKTNDVWADGVGFIEYKFTAANRSSLAEMNGGVLNGKAIDLPPPALPPDTEFSGAVGVRVRLDEDGNVVSAKAVSGNPCLGEAAEAAARKAKFTRTLLSGAPVRISSIITYYFPPKNQ